MTKAEIATIKASQNQITERISRLTLKYEHTVTELAELRRQLVVVQKTLEDVLSNIRPKSPQW